LKELQQKERALRQLQRHQQLPKLQQKEEKETLLNKETLKQTPPHMRRGLLFEGFLIRFFYMRV
jgi:hypothetical protein